MQSGRGLSVEILICFEITAGLGGAGFRMIAPSPQKSLGLPFFVYFKFYQYFDI
jgi:hypothetical protein